MSFCVIIRYLFPTAKVRRFPQTTKNYSMLSGRIVKWSFAERRAKGATLDKSVLIVDKSVLFEDNFAGFAKMALYCRA